MHYQVSLTQNIIKEFSDFDGEIIEIDRRMTDGCLKPPERIDKICFQRCSSISPSRDNDAQSKNTAAIKKNNDKKVSPCNSIEILDKVLQKRLNFNSFQSITTRKNTKNSSNLNQRKSVSPFRSISPISASPLQNVKHLFSEFCSKYSTTQKTLPKTYNNQMIKAQFKYIQTIRENTFQSQLVKKIIFNAWNNSIKRKANKNIQL